MVRQISWQLWIGILLLVTCHSDQEKALSDLRRFIQMCVTNLPQKFKFAFAYLPETENLECATCSTLSLNQIPS